MVGGRGRQRRRGWGPPRRPRPASPPLQAFFAEVRGVDRDAEVNRILNAFKLNPYELLGARFDAGPDGIQRAYRKARTGGRQGG